MHDSDDSGASGPAQVFLSVGLTRIATWCPPRNLAAARAGCVPSCSADDRANSTPTCRCG